MKTYTRIISLILCLFLMPISFAQNSVAIDSVHIKQHQFDFWLGHWEVYKYGTDTLVGISHIESIIDSIGLLEHYQTASGKYHGKSLNKYNATKNQWEQFWVDNGGLTLSLSGGISNGKMVLQNQKAVDKQVIINRISWQQCGQDSVRQTWDLNKNDGKGWRTLFDGLYIKTK